MSSSSFRPHAPPGYRPLPSGPEYQIPNQNRGPYSTNHEGYHEPKPSPYSNPYTDQAPFINPDNIPSIIDAQRKILYIFLFSSLFFGTCFWLLPSPLYLNEVPGPRKAQISGLLGGSLYVFSGRGNHQLVYQDLWSYDLFYRKWKR